MCTVMYTTINLLNAHEARKISKRTHVRILMIPNKFINYIENY